MKNRLFAVAICLLFLGSCTIANRSEKNSSQNLLKRLQIWEMVRLDGIATFHYKNLVIRKNFVFQIQNETFRVDVIDSGFLGMNSGSLVSMSCDSLGCEIVIDRSYPVSEQKKEEIINKTNQYRQRFFQALTNLRDAAKEVAVSKSYESEGLIFAFDAKCRLSSVFEKEQEIELKIEYDEMGEPMSIVAKIKSEDFVELQINRLKTDNFTIVPVSRAFDKK